MDSYSSQYCLLTVQFGRTALILATMGGHTLTVQSLIGGEADLNIQDRVSGSCCSTTIILSKISMSSNVGCVLSKF